MLGHTRYPDYRQLGFRILLRHAARDNRGSTPQDSFMPKNIKPVNFLPAILLAILSFSCSAGTCTLHAGMQLQRQCHQRGIRHLQCFSAP